MRFRSRYRAGDWVRVRSRQEILATLDERGALESLPFMPEMLAFCGKRFRVAASAHKTCDTVNYTGGRRMRNAVHLEGLRCDGAAHDGCQARCLLFWKEQWLVPAPGAQNDRAGSSGPQSAPPASAPARDSEAPPVCREADLQRLTRTGTDSQSITYSCQATRLFEATTRLPSWNLRQYVADVRSGNVRFAEALKLLSLALLYNMRRMGIGYRFWNALYESAHRRLMHGPSPYGEGTVPAGAPTPDGSLGLQPGELVEVKTHEEILRTLNERNRNRGLSFDKEMVRYCGRQFRVAARIRHIINETTGKMLQLPDASVTLEETYCTSCYSERRLLCPRRIIPFWREVWLRRPGQQG